MSLRLIPHLTDFRPADANETAACWQLALERKSASFMALSRQDLPVLDAAKYNVMAGVAKGAYVVEKGGDAPKLLIVATGAELWPALEAAKKLSAEGVANVQKILDELELAPGLQHECGASTTGYQVAFALTRRMSWDSDDGDAA